MDTQNTSNYEMAKPHADSTKDEKRSSPRKINEEERKYCEDDEEGVLDTRTYSGHSISMRIPLR